VFQCLLNGHEKRTIPPRLFRLEKKEAMTSSPDNCSAMRKGFRATGFLKRQKFA